MQLTTYSGGYHEASDPSTRLSPSAGGPPCQLFPGFPAYTGSGRCQEATMNKAWLVSILFLAGYLLNGCGGGGASVHTTMLAITSQAPPNGMTHTMYAGSPNGFSVTASGGTTPYHWSWAAASGSSLPPGLSLSNAAISGTPSATGSFAVIVTLTDSASPVAQQAANYTIKITALVPPSISTSPAPPAGAVNVPYPGFTFNATGGAPPLAWSETGSLPPGMVLGTEGGLSGTPTATVSFPITVMVQDADHQDAAPQNFTIQIDPQLPSFTPTGSMQTPRALHTATLLSNGKVIVIGGLGDNGALASAEVFDPTRRQFITLTGHLM